MKLKRDFFERDTLVVARKLLGKYLIRELREKSKKKKVLIGKIVETEAYIGEDDLACHASKGKTPRTQIMYGEAGHAYIYMIYGMYHCLNIITEKVGFPAAVLIRAIEPISVRHSEEEGRGISNTGILHSIQNDKKLASGPGKLCRWMKIDRELNGVDVTKSEELFITDKIPSNCHPRPPLSFPRKRESRSFGRINSSGNQENVAIGVVDPRVKPEDDSGVEFEIVETKRIGVDYAKHCADHPWRFYIKANPFVSKK